MKIKITYQQEEVRKMRLIISFITGRMPAAKIRFSDRHAPYFHAYLTVMPQAEEKESGQKSPH